MDDRTLLELAAKAAGISIDQNTFGEYQGFHGGMVVADGKHWNPLFEDADALRLAVDLNITFRNFGHIMTAVGSGGQFNEYADGDAYAATRRAITRAAAEIGRAIP